MREIIGFAARARHFRRAVATAAIVALAMAGLSASASAATTSSHASVGGDVPVVHLEFTLDCAHMSVSARQYANAHHYCSAARAAGIRPDSTGTAAGTCGTSFITINDLRHGNAQFIWGFSSSLGAVIDRNLELSWVNETFKGKGFGGWPDNSIMAGVNYSSSPMTVQTGEGDIFGDLGGSVVLWWGARCYLNNPVTTQHIST
jgi:hypothetical protein